MSLFKKVWEKTWEWAPAAILSGFVMFGLFLFVTLKHMSPAWHVISLILIPLVPILILVIGYVIEKDMERTLSN